MNKNYLNNKLLVGFGIFTILFGIINLSAFAQQTKLVNTKIQQSNDAYGNRLKSSVTNKNQIKSRNSLVSAWKKQDPSVAPFLGSWLAGETIWSIYPSITKEQVCLVRREMNTAVLDVGRIKNGKIHLQSGWVISPTGEYLDVAASNFSERLKIFGTLEEPSSLQYVDNSYLTPLLRAYKQAGCTVSLPSKNTANNSNSQSTLPSQELVNAIRKHTSNPNISDVEYSFFEIDLNGDGNKDAIVYETGSHCGQVNCYLSIFLKNGNNYQHLGTDKYILQTFNSKVAILKDSHSGLIDIAMPAFSFNPSEYDKVKGWKTYQFNGKEYTSINSVSNSINYKTIIDFEKTQRFNLAASGLSNNDTTAQNNISSPQPQIKIPDSFKLTLDNGMKTEFVKGADGYYTWFVTNYIISGTCLGLKDNQDPAKVKLAPYGCKSKKKAKKWEIVMANNNTGYKVKLPNTSYCLADNVGIVDCNDSEATVIDLTPEQLKSWTSR